MSSPPPFPPSPPSPASPDTAVPRLQAQMADPKVTLPEALELALVKAAIFEQHLQEHGVDLAEMGHVMARIREATYWCSELGAMMRLLAQQKQGPGIQVVQDIPAHLKNLVQQ